MGLMQGGSSSYIGALAASHAFSEEMDLSEESWNSAATTSLTAPFLYFIIILEQKFMHMMCIYV